MAPNSIYLLSKHEKEYVAVLSEIIAQKQPFTGVQKKGALEFFEFCSFFQNTFTRLE